MHLLKITQMAECRLGQRRVREAMGRSEKGLLPLVGGVGETLQRKGWGSWIRIKKMKMLRESLSRKRQEKQLFKWSSWVEEPVCREQSGRQGWKEVEETGWRGGVVMG